MKIKRGLFFIICVAVIVFAVYFFVQPERTTYEFTPKTSLAFFGVEPEAFFDTYYGCYDSCEDFRKHAEINSRGNLVLRLSKAQEEAYLNVRNSNLDAFKKVEGVQISEDYSKISITATKEEFTQIIWHEFSMYTVFDMAGRQLIIDKVAPEDIRVTFEVIDESTGGIVYSAIWPEEVVEISIKDWDW